MNVANPKGGGSEAGRLADRANSRDDSALQPQELGAGALPDEAGNFVVALVEGGIDGGGAGVEAHAAKFKGLSVHLAADNFQGVEGGFIEQIADFPEEGDGVIRGERGQILGEVMIVHDDAHAPEAREGVAQAVEQFTIGALAISGDAGKNDEAGAAVVLQFDPEIFRGVMKEPAEATVVFINDTPEGNGAAGVLGGDEDKGHVRDRAAGAHPELDPVHCMAGNDKIISAAHYRGKFITGRVRCQSVVLYSSESLQ